MSTNGIEQEMVSLVPVRSEQDILPKWIGTPIADLLAYQNLGKPFAVYDQAEVILTMCMDYRKTLRIPGNFAYILRTAGGNPSRTEFEISFAIAVKGIRSLALIAHDDCGMVGLKDRRDTFVQGLVRAGWSGEDAGYHFDNHAPSYEILDPVRFVSAQARDLQKRYPTVTVAPLFYSVEDGLLYQI